MQVGILALFYHFLCKIQDLFAVTISSWQDAKQALRTVYSNIAAVSLTDSSVNQNCGEYALFYGFPAQEYISLSSPETVILRCPILLW